MKEVVVLPFDPKNSDLTPEIKNAIKKDCPNASDDELERLWYRSKITGLNIFNKQIMGIHRWSKKDRKKVMTIQIGIGGYRSIARRDPYDAGTSEPQFEWKSPLTHEEGEKVHEKIYSVTITAFRLIKGTQTIARYPYTAWWDEYYPGEGSDGFMWRKMPRWMIVKCALAGALRSAYPDELNDTYEHAEMDRANAESKGNMDAKNVDQVVVEDKGSTIESMQKDHLLSHILSMSKEICREMSAQEKGQWMVANLRVNNFNDLRQKTEKQLQDIINNLSGIVPEGVKQ